MAPFRLTFRPHAILPLIALFFFVISTILGYALFVGVYGFSRSLVFSELLSTGCDLSLLATFIPDVLNLGYSLALVSFTLYLVFDYAFNGRGWKLFFGSLAVFSLFWMISFPTSRGTFPDLFHQISAGFGVLSISIYLAIDAFRAMPRTMFRIAKILAASAMLVVLVGMGASYLAARIPPDRLWKWNVFAVFQFLMLGIFFFYLLLIAGSSYRMTAIVTVLR